MFFWCKINDVSRVPTLEDPELEALGINLTIDTSKFYCLTPPMSSHEATQIIRILSDPKTRTSCDGEEIRYIETPGDWGRLPVLSAEH